MKIYMYVYIISYIATVINKNILAMFGLEKICKGGGHRSFTRKFPDFFQTKHCKNIFINHCCNI